MPRSARCVLPGLAYHVTQRGTDHQRVFFTAADRRTYLGLLKENLEDCEVRVWAYCLMTNHVHLVVVPEREDSLAVLFRRVHGRYAQYVNARRRRSGHLWQNRFFSCPLSASHQWKALAYVERNPVRAGMVDNAADYRWSSAAAHLTGRDGTGLIDWGIWREQGGAESWAELVASPEELSELQLLRRCTYAGRPFGEECFTQEIETKLQRKWRRWGFEKRAMTAVGS